MNEFFLAIDIGGTKTRIGTVARDDPGSVVTSVTIPTIRDDPAASILATVREARALVPAEGQFLVAGVAAPGPLDTKARRPGRLPNLPAWGGYPLGDALEEALGVPVILENDANVAAYGELFFGSGRGLSDFLLVTVGTGVGGALVSGGRLIKGARDGAGEIGHLQANPDGPMCGCGRRGCVEAMASGSAILREYGKPAGEAFAKAAGGEIRAREVLAAAGRALGMGIASVVTILEPSAVVIGGGLSQIEQGMFSFYLGPCRDEVAKRSYRMWGQDVPLMVAELGGDGPLLGAAMLARETHAMGQARKVDKPWGEEVWWARTERYVGKRISVRAGHSLSLQYHERKLETMHFVSGTGLLFLGDDRIPIVPGLTVTIEPRTRHRVEAWTDLVFLEASTPEVDDVVRLEDKYGRAPRSL
ncbi:MAG: ROK family protein [Bacillota bacterium]